MERDLLVMFICVYEQLRALDGGIVRGRVTGGLQAVGSFCMVHYARDHEVGSNIHVSSCD